jgi:hypothetical protein
MATRTGIELLSALRRAGSTAAVREVPETFFIEDDERAAFVWMRDHVAQFRAFPNPDLFFRQTGIRTLNVSQPVSFYIDEARKRSLYNVLTEPFGQMRDAIEGMNPDAMVEIARAMVQASAQLAAKGTDYIPLEAALEQVMTDFELAQRSIGMRGITSGWSYVDEQTGGWQNDDLISLVGRIGVGKTYIILFFAYSAWRAGYSVLLNTNELGTLQLARRVFGIHSRINPTLIRKGMISTVVARTLRSQASAMLHGVPFNIVAGGFRKSVTTVRAVAEATLPDIILVDAAYLLEPEKKRRGSEGRRETVSDTIEDLKRVVMDLNRPLIQSVQFNRKAETVRTRDNSQSNDPTAHLTLAKIGETDVIGQASSLAIGMAMAYPPMERIRRWFRFMKGREGESGVWQSKYEHSPVDFSIVSVGEPRGGAVAEQPDLSHMV